MNKLAIYTLKAFRKAYTRSFKDESKLINERIIDPDVIAEMIYQKLTDDKPCMVGRFGYNELSTVSNYIGVKKHRNRIFSYITGKTPPWWWDENNITNMHVGAGFFPPSIENLEKFSELMLNDMGMVDILGSWLSNERYFEEELKNSQGVRLVALEPFWAQKPWTRALKGKKVLVIHPFAETIKSQYKKRELLFKNKDVLPDFELITIKAVQSIAGTKTPYKDWFEALEYMKNEIDKTDYDICIIGAGAYGFPLAAHVKRTGKKGFHIGGSLQLMFGIRGKRWENNYHKLYDYKGLVNEHWTRATQDEKPPNANKVEDGCYW